MLKSTICWCTKCIEMLCSVPDWTSIGKVLIWETMPKHQCQLVKVASWWQWAYSCSYQTLLFLLVGVRVCKLDSPIIILTTSLLAGETIMKLGRSYDWEQSSKDVVAPLSFGYTIARPKLWRHNFGSKVSGAKTNSQLKTPGHIFLKIYDILKEQTTHLKRADGLSMKSGLWWKWRTSGRIVQGWARVNWPESHRGHCCLRLGLYTLLHSSQLLAFSQLSSNSTLRRSLAPHEDLCRCNKGSHPLPIVQFFYGLWPPPPLVLQFLKSA